MKRLKHRVLTPDEAEQWLRRRRNELIDQVASGKVTLNLSELIHLYDLAFAGVHLDRAVKLGQVELEDDE